jgi:hypothetical protein
MFRRSLVFVLLLVLALSICACASAAVTRTSAAVTRTSGAVTPTLAGAVTPTLAGAVTQTSPGAVIPPSLGARTLAPATTANPNTPIPVAPSDIPYPGRHLSANEVIHIAEALPKVRHERAHYPGSYGGAYLKGPGRWQVSYFSRQGKEIVQVYIADATGRVLEQWTGFQVAWTMARGYPGAFGRHVNALYVWLPLCALFFIGLCDWRRPFSLLHLDLLVLLSFSVSLAFFNHANIYASVPLTYPPLVYLLVRMLLLLRRSSGHSADHPATARGSGPWQPRLPPEVLAVGLVFLIGFRIGLNVADSNVIDVGYAGVIGAHRLVHGQSLYGGYPSENEHGDTYGPVNYEAYVPFVALFGWSGHWDDLPAAHAFAIFCDLLAMGLLFLLGRRVRGPSLGIVLAYAWAAYPFTLYALESNSNDVFVGALVLAAVLFATSPPARGLFAALAGLTKFAPLALAPLLATHGLRELPSRFDRTRALAGFVAAFLLTAAVVSIPAFTHDSLHTIYERTFVYQSNRGSPFSVWGLYGLHGFETVAQAAAVALALLLAFLPRRPDAIGLAAACAAVLIAMQLGLEHWFYLYIPWFFGLVMLALFGGPPEAVSAPSAVGTAYAQAVACSAQTPTLSRT